MASRAGDETLGRPDASTADGSLRAKMLELLQARSREVRDLDLGRHVDRVPLSSLSPMRFATEYVQRNKPLIITGAIDSWPAMRLWSETYLAEHAAGQVPVTVDVTPNGRGDAITDVAVPGSDSLARWFVTPHERRMTLRQFFSLMRETRARDQQAAGQQPAASGCRRVPPREVPYMQHQNSNLSEELSPLLADIGEGLGWAEEVFGGPPEATNLWIGDERSATSFHKDHYENLYAVIRGTKVFTLLPPCDVFRMALVRCPAARYLPYRDLPQGARFGEVAPYPGSKPLPQPPQQRQQEAEAAAQAGPATAAEAEVEEVEEGRSDSGRLVAMLQEPGYEVLWSAVDTTIHDREARQQQPLFYGPQPQVASGTFGSKDSDSSSSSGNGHRCNGHAEEDGCGSSRSSCSGSSSAGGDDDPWDAAGGAPLIAEVGPGEVLYLPSMWYHQVEQRTAAAADSSGSTRGSGGSRAADSLQAAMVAALRQMGHTVLGAEAAASAAAAEIEAAAGDEDGAAGAAGRGSEAGGSAAGGEENEYVIAVNFWYDMRYDSRYSDFKFSEGLAVALGLAEEPPGREGGDAVDGTS